MSNRFTVFLLMSVVILSSCTQDKVKPGDPKSRLKSYIEKSFSVNSYSDKKELEEFLTGDVRTRFSAWSEEQFRQAFIESKREFIKLVFKELRKTDENKVNLTYELVYMEDKKNTRAKVTNKKLCHMVKRKGVWYISRVRNIKELVEYQDALSLP